MRRLLVLPLLLAAIAPASASEQWWEYRDWRVHVATVDTGEDLRVTCRAATGGDGDPVLAIEISNGDVLPPSMFPPVAIEEYAPRGYATLLQDGDTVRFVLDSGSFGEGYVRAGHDAGIPFAVGVSDEMDTLALLQGMRRGDRLAVFRGGDLVYTASLAGFTAAYGKVAEQCGFPTTGVID